MRNNNKKIKQNINIEVGNRDFILSHKAKTPFFENGIKFQSVFHYTVYNDFLCLGMDNIANKIIKNSDPKYIHKVYETHMKPLLLLYKKDRSFILNGENVSFNKIHIDNYKKGTKLKFEQCQIVKNFVNSEESENIKFSYHSKHRKQIWNVYEKIIKKQIKESKKIQKEDIINFIENKKNKNKSTLNIRNLI